MNLGYCCINLSLREQGITVNRSMIKRTWQAHGLARASELALLNLQDLKTILRWNLLHGIKIYRMSSDIFPWMSEYRFEDLPNFDQHLSVMREIGRFVQTNDMRISFHPGQFDVLASPNEDVVRRTIYDLDQHSRIMDLMELPVNYSFPINIHVGGTYGDKAAALQRFCVNFMQLAVSTRCRLVVENDDKASQYGVRDLYEGIYEKIGVPITFDFFHHGFCTNDLSVDEAATLAASTWPSYTRPLAHFSSSKRLHEDSSVIERSHADYLYDTIPPIGALFDIEVEAKAKDLAVLKYLNENEV
jgi:UV DNA damage endonuclease